MKTLGALLLLVATAIALAGCADDGSGASASASASGSTAGTGCEVVDGTTAARDGEIHVDLDEWAVKPDTSSIGAGNIELDAANVGKRDHELVIVEGATPSELPITKDGLDEAALPKGARVLGEIEGFPAGDSCNGTFELAAGDYTLLCNLTEKGIGSHARYGMVKALTVR
jgi:hypothetical protein